MDLKIVFLGPEFIAKGLQEAIGYKAVIVRSEADSSAVANALKDADAMLDASMKIRLTDSMFKDAPKLRIISCATTGSDHIDRLELNRRGIPVRTLKEDQEFLQNITPAAELSWAILMACARKIPAAFDHVKSGKWVREEFPGVMLKGKCLGIIGCGRIGGWMGRYARAFGMKVVGHDPHIETFPSHISPVLLKELVSISDFITVHVHLTEKTHGLVSKDLFEMMKSGAVFINTSRGAIIDEFAMLNELKSGRLAAAGLDVFSDEPNIDQSPLVQYARQNDNLIITPHCGGFSPDAVKLVCIRAMEKISEHLKL